MDKLALADYCANLISIMESKEAAGLPRGNTLVAEYNRHYELLIERIKADEARNGEQHSL